MRAVVDSTPLIYLAKIGRLELLRTYSDVFIPRAGHEETVVKGLEKRFPDAKLIQREMEKGTIKLQELSAHQQREARELMKFAEIEAGEAEAIVLAKNLRSDMLLDDLVAQGVAKALNLKPLWTTSFVLKLFAEKKLPKKEARKIIEELVGAGYRIGEDVLIELFRKLE